MKNGDLTIRRITEGGVIAALYVGLTFLSSLFGMSSGFIQFRISEILCILPVFTPAAIPGLAIGCALANLLTGALPFDVLFGSLATLLGAVGTYLLRKHKILALLPPIVSNTVIVPLVLLFVYFTDASYLLMCLSIGISEALSAGVGGYFVAQALRRLRVYKKDTEKG